jgi:putative alpha-1,2-mannosidase
LWDTKEPTFDSFYCIWDTFRFSHPLYNIFVPEAQSQMVRSLIDIFRFEGWLPECRYPSKSYVVDPRMSFCKGITQSGSNADTLLTDAYLKGVTGVPWSDALQAIRKVSSFVIYSKIRTQKLSQRTGELKDAEIFVTTTV